MFTYRRQPSYLVDIFPNPYLRTKRVLTRMAKDNQNIFIMMVRWLFHGKRLLNAHYFGKSLFKSIQRATLLMMQNDYLMNIAILFSLA